MNWIGKFILDGNRLVKNRIYMRILAVILTAFMMLSVAGCGTKVVLTTGFGKDDIFVIGDAKCTRPEMLVYLTDIQSQYENVYGDGIWDAELDGVTLEDNVKDTVLARIAQVKTMYLMAVAEGLVLSEEDIEKVNSAASEYYLALTARQAEYMGITQEMLETMYKEYALADRVYEAVIAEINPEISDDEARTVVVQHIFLATGVVDGAGDFIMYSQERKAEVYNKAMEIKSRAEGTYISPADTMTGAGLSSGTASGTNDTGGIADTEGNAISEPEDFAKLAEEYSEEDTFELSFGRGVMDPAIELEVFKLATGQVSSIVETETGLHIFKCISTLDREQTEANKAVLVEQRRQEAFKTQYNAFVSGLVKNLNNELWDEITLDREFEVNCSFFEIYDEKFKEIAVSKESEVY